MSNKLLALHRSTLDLIERLQEADENDFSRLIILRKRALNELSRQEQVTEEDKCIIRELGQFDEPLMKRMIELKDEAANGLRRVAQSKKQRALYQAPWAAQSYFFDRKK